MKSFGNIAKDGQVRAVASGTLPNGNPVIVNSDGTVSVVAGSNDSVDQLLAYDSFTVGEQFAAYDSTNNYICINYRDVNNSSYGTAVVGKIVSGTLTWGIPVVYESAATDYQQAVFDSSANKFVLVYSTSATGRAIVGTPSGSGESATISFGSSTTFDSGQGVYLAATFDNNSNKVVVGYGGTNNYLETKVGTVSGTSISFGTAVVAYSSSFEHLCATFDSNLNKVVFGFRKSTTGRAVVGTVSGTSISFGSNTAYESSSTTNQQDATFDTSNNKVVIAYRAVNASDAGRAVVGTVSGTSISFGTPVDFATSVNEKIGVTFDSSVNKVVIAFNDGSTSKGTVITGTVSGTSISFDTPVVFKANNCEKNTIVFDSSANKSVIGFKDTGNNNRGIGAVFTAGSTNITSENFIGFSDGAYADTRSAAINTTNTIDRNQSGLTAGQTYFVQTDGTLGLTADDPSVTAGTAISSTEIIVKG